MDLYSYPPRADRTEQPQNFAGHGDYLLNQAGIDQAMEAGRWFASRSIRFDEVYSSPLRRALDTAAYVAPGIPVTIDNRLIEMCFGPYEGMDLTKPLPEVVTFFQDFEHTPAPEDGNAGQRDGQAWFASGRTEGKSGQEYSPVHSCDRNEGRADLAEQRLR